MASKRSSPRQSSRRKSSGPSARSSTRSATTATATATAPASALRITRRVVNSKRHTVGYAFSNGKTATVRQAAQMARRITGVRRVGNHIQAQPNCRKLQTLPITFQK